MALILVSKTLFIYFIILLIMKFMGKREIGQLSLFDFVVLLLIADVAVISIDEKDNFLIYIIPIIVLALVQKALAYILLKLPNLREFFDGKESIIIYEGKLNIKEMRKQNYNIDDLLPQLRLKNIKSLSEIRYLILEPNGEISIFRFDDSNKTFADSSSGSKATNISAVSITGSENLNDISIFPLIVSGKVNHDHLNLLSLKEEWLRKEIHKQGYHNYKDIYYANFENGKLFICETIELDNYKNKKNRR